ncbi:unnamed protein product [Fraxinus pennsylvanica]|uniref:Uncharacterized protein n=1 Tax=Fraxinus pennsylvanica TaxID=56036 RepID=A0AAD2E4P7_9LAMI|nr:unnamed protein product [Fraxinus pennsylvanica]
MRPPCSSLYSHYWLLFSRIVSKIAGENHLQAWRNNSLAAAGSSSLVAYAVTTFAFGLVCKEISIGRWKGWSSRYGRGYGDPDYSIGAPGAEHVPKDGGVTGTGV